MASTRVGMSIKNIGVGLASQLLTMAVNFAARVEFVAVLGIGANGINGLFNDVIAILSLAELGVGTAVTYSLYKPLASGDEKRISGIMRLFKTAYRIIAISVFAMGIAVLPFVHLLVKNTDFAVSYIRRIFFLFLLRAVTTYLMSYKTSLIIADQRAYVVSAVSAVSKAVCAAVCIASLFVWQSFEIYLGVIIVFNLLTNLALTVYSSRRYPYLNRKDRLSAAECKEILSNIRHVFVGKVSGRITNSTDSILISVLVSTVATGIYGNYSLIIVNIKQIFERIGNSVVGSIGNMMASESGEYCERVLGRLMFAFFAFGMIFGGGMISASAPFIGYFFGESNKLDGLTLLLCSYNLFVSIFILPLWSITGVSGLFATDKKISVIGSTVNLAVSLALGVTMGMSGIFIGTTCTYLIQIFLKIHMLYKRRFGIPPARRFIRTAKMLVMALAVLLFERTVCETVVFESLMAEFAVRGVISVAISAAAVTVIYGRSDELAYFAGLIKKRYFGRVRSNG